MIRLAAGDLVPAGARLLQVVSLHVQQAALTGVSMPVEKEARDLPENPKKLADARNMVYLGTSVVSGTATAVIALTGRATAFGDIAARLATHPPETGFERGIRKFGPISSLYDFLLSSIEQATTIFPKIKTVGVASP